MADTHGPDSCSRQLAAANKLQTEFSCLLLPQLPLLYSLE